MGCSARILAVATLGIAACGYNGVASGTGEAPGGAEQRATDPAKAEGGAPDNHDARVGPPACDPASDATCLPLPDGWRLVVETPLTTGAAPACPQGYGAASDVGAGPKPRADACDCATCTIAQKPTCAGAVSNSYSYGGNCGSSSSALGNSPAGQCGTDLYTGDLSTAEERYTMPGPSGGSCSPGAAVAHADRVDFAERARLCDGNSRCSGSTCDARVTPPFRACFSSDGDRACPAGFPEKHVVGASAAFDCASTCGCTVATRTCAPILNLYASATCAGVPHSVPADGVCRSGFSGSYNSYKVTTAPDATCAPSGGNPVANNVRLDAMTTVCCR